MNPNNLIANLRNHIATIQAFATECRSKNSLIAAFILDEDVKRAENAIISDNELYMMSCYNSLSNWIV